MSRTKSPRERKYDYTTIRSIAIGVINEVARRRLPHSEMLALRTTRVFQHDCWKRLPAYRQADILGMFSGAVEAWHACGAVVWTHTVAGGQIHVAPLPMGHSYGSLESSAHRWAADLSRVFYEGSNTMEPYARIEAANES